MSTRGIYGYRIAGKDRLTYRHEDSHPHILGIAIVRYLNDFAMENGFSRDDLITELGKKFSALKMVKEKDMPASQDVEYYWEEGIFNSSDPTKVRNANWGYVLRGIQGISTLEHIASGTLKHLVENKDFICSSCFCRWAYIINFDDRLLEIYQGDQTEPDPNNRFGTEADENGYYPCKLILSYSLDKFIAVDENELFFPSKSLSNYS